METLGLQQVTLKDDTQRHPGMFTVVPKAKRRFTAAQANQPAGESTVRLTSAGSASTVTKKKD